MCVGRNCFLITEVIAAIIVVLLAAFPSSHCTTKAGRTPFWIDPPLLHHLSHPSLDTTRNLGYEYVKEFGEGVDRMFNEMENAGLPDPEYTDNAFMLNVTIRNGLTNGEINGELNRENGEINGELNPALLYLNKSELAIYHLIKKAPQNSRQEIATQLNLSTRTVDRVIRTLIQKDLIVREGSKKTGHWEVK